MSITTWGWNSFFEVLWRGGDWGNAVPARVVAQLRKFWRVAGEFGECWAEASGKLRLAADEGADWPAVGDWVVVELHGADTTAVIQEVLPGRSKFVRKSPGKKMEEQVIAANAFADIDSLATQCRFGDCRHEAEPGCAVLAALSAGTLDPARVENRRKILREQEFLRRKIDPAARLEQKEQWKRIHRAARQKEPQRQTDGGKR